MADTTNGNGAILHVERHPQYYISGADLSILVEHIQFRVHRYFFERESKYFASKLAGPASPGQQPVGSSDSSAVVLEDLTASQFENFLWVFYNPRYSIYEAGADVWETILTLAERWSFPEVKSLSVRELEKKSLTDVKRIKLYHLNNVDRNILIPRYAALCEREEPLTLEEGLDLGMETTLMIAKGREEVRAARLPSGARSPLTPTVHGEDLRAVIRELFKIAPKAESGAEEPEAATPIITGALTTTKPKTVTAPAKPPVEKPKIQTQTKTKAGNKKAAKGPQTAVPPSSTPTTTTLTPPTKETKPLSLPSTQEVVDKTTGQTKAEEEEGENKGEDKAEKGEPVSAKDGTAVGADGGAVAVDAPAAGETDSALIDIVSPTPTTTTANNTTLPDDLFGSTTTTTNTSLPDPLSNPFSFSFGSPSSAFGNTGFEPNPKNVL
uniref:BTB domain-containing protein n=1 Tax=Psilocybe cubensis TaxID=181762 RepID=A0A8H7Y8P3_PSICU